MLLFSVMLLFAKYLEAQVVLSGPTPYLDENITYGGVPAAASVDMDGDGDLDIVTGGNAFSSSFVVVGLNDGTGGFTRGAKVPVHLFNRDFAVGDLNNDGLPDIVTVGEPVGDWTFQVILNSSSAGNFSLSSPISYFGQG
ncbi:MAG: VCBS repeat-containing protein, partial [Bacteroidota bacterium]